MRAPPDNARTCYIIRHKESHWVIPGEFLKGKGSSWLELADPELHMPRLFRTRKGAVSFIGQWCRGRMRVKGFSYAENPEGGAYVDVEPVRSRKKEDLEIVRATVTW